MLDLEVSRLVQQAHLLERACHDPGPWSIRVDSLDLPVEKTLLDRGVVFVGQFPDACPLVTDDQVIDLVCAGEVAASRTVRLPVTGPFVIDWTVKLSSAPVAA